MREGGLIYVVCVTLQEKEQKYTLKLDEMKVRDVETGRFAIGKKHAFALFYSTGKLVVDRTFHCCLFLFV